MDQIEAAVAETTAKLTGNTKALTEAQRILADAQREVASTASEVATANENVAASQNSVTRASQGAQEAILRTATLRARSLAELRSALFTFGFTGSFGRFSRTLQSFESGHVDQMRLNHPEDF